VVGFSVDGGDAFAWKEHVTGTASCSGLSLQDDGQKTGVTVTTSGQEFDATVSLQPGTDLLTATCTDSGGATQESAPLVFDERLQAGPKAWIHVSVSGDTVTLDGTSSENAQPDDAKIVRYAWSADPRHPVSLTLAGGKALRGSVAGSKLQLRAPSKDGEYYVRLTVTDAKGRSDSSATYFEVQNGQARAVDLMREHPSWIDSAVIYAPIPELFGNGGPKAVERKLPYLKKLGVNALWLWPPAELRTPGEEYAVDDYYQLDPQWGPEPAFKHMVDAAHRLGMHVMIDIVPNHMSDQSPYFQDTVANGKASHYYDFFDRKPDGTPTHYFDWTNLPNLNYANPEVRSMVIGAFVHWIRDLGIDGFRVDAAWGVERRAPDFWPEWRRELKRVDPDLLLLAEGSAVDPYFFSHGFDVAYDWTDHPGQWAWQSVFEFPQESGALLKPAVLNPPRGFAPDAIVMHFLNNNDTGIRFVDQYGPEMTRVAATLQFTLPGIPEMFAGDEIGASYEPYSNLTPISWKDKHGLLPFYETLISLKRHMPTLRSHDVDVLDVSADSAFAYIRPAFGGGPPVVVLLNFGSKQPDLTITKTPALAAVIGSGSMTDLLTGKAVKLHVGSKDVVFPMAATSAFVLVPKGAA